MAQVFICYSHKDEAARAELVEHLKNLDHLGIKTWSDRDIPSGSDWLPEIERILQSCSAAILLVSKTFLNSRFITTVEVPALLDARQKRGAVVVPLIVRPCNWQTKDWLARMQARPWEARPLMSMKPTARDAVLAALALEVAEVVGLRQKPPAIAPATQQTRMTIEVTLNGTYDPHDREGIAMVERSLQQATGDPQLRIRRVAPGSQRFYVELSAEAHRRLQEAVAQGYLTPPGVRITSRSAEVDIVRMRGVSVLLDEAIALMFERGTKVINQARDRNRDRFPPDYAFQLTTDEWSALQSQFVTAKPGRGGRRTPPWAYTEQGIAMLATVLRTPRAVEAAKLIIETFVAARRQARPVPPGNHDGIGDPSRENADKQAFKRRLASFDSGEPDG